MAAALGRVLDDASIPSAIVGRESMGAAAALLFALNSPERVEALILMAPAFGPSPNTELERLETLDSAFEVFTEPASVGRACVRFLQDAGKVGCGS